MIESTHPASAATPVSIGARAHVDALPGKLRGDVWLTVQTRHAQRLITGRPRSEQKPAITGLVGFADRLRVIWNAARADDPYADWWLLKIEHALEMAEIHLSVECHELDRLLRHESAFEVQVAASEKPYRLALCFASPHAYRGAQLVASFDATACHVLTLKHIGVLGCRHAESTLGGCASVVRRLFAIPQGYRVLGIDRAAIRAGNDAARAAAARMGELPKDVLAGENLALLAPRPRPPVAPDIARDTAAPAGDTQ